ncbi:hypothetical protein [Flavobacterium sp.]|uniref:hypothetical protein n=1 Tax=Flavobacterium sp. TaxID=239 RepID=UPI003750C97A
MALPRTGTGTFNSPDSGAILWGGYPNTTDYYELDIHDYKSTSTPSIFIHMQAIHANGIGTSIINESNGMTEIYGLNHNYMHCKIFKASSNSYQYFRSYANSGTLTITKYDYLNKIISGTFSCKVKNSTNPLDEIEITQGRFDIKWHTVFTKVIP